MHVLGSELRGIDGKSESILRSICEIDIQRLIVIKKISLLILRVMSVLKYILEKVLDLFFLVGPYWTSCP